MKKRIIYLLLLLVCFTANSQTIPQGISYQGIARNSSGNLLANQAIQLKFGIYINNTSGQLQYEETHNITTNQLGLFNLIIGTGTNTGLGSAVNFSSIDWGLSNQVLKVMIDASGGTNFSNIDTLKFWSVPYAFNSKVANTLSHPLRLNQLADVDTIGVTNGYVLKWNGQVWMPAPDNNSDTALYAANSGHSTYADTALYSSNINNDTAIFAYNSGFANNANQANNSNNSIHSNYSDTATYAINTANQYNYWNLNGNSNVNPNTNYLGTSNANDLVIKTNGTEKVRITSAGKIGVGISAPIADLHIVGENGIIAEGTYGAGTAYAPSTAGTRLLWYPKKAAFRAGTVAGNSWSDANIGNYSFATGYDTKASGQYSTALGRSDATGDYGFAACQAALASGFSSVAIGSGAVATRPYTVAIGRGTQANDTGAVSIGYHSRADGKYSTAFGYTTIASGAYSVASGYYARTNNKVGSFIFADYSSQTITNSTADNQFMVRAANGYYLYSNTALTSGVILSAGGGSWASVSDRRKKENFKKVNASEILKKIEDLEITSWNYKSQNKSIRHIGPMAQDFYAAFNFGESDTTITTVDIDGINIAAIQALAKKADELKQKAEELESLKQKMAELQNEKIILEKRIIAIENKMILNEKAKGKITAQK